MKKIILIIITILFLSCEKVTVLEVSIDKDYYKVTYYKEHFDLINWKNTNIYECNFKTFFGVNSFLNNVADKDLSGWNIK